MKKIVFILAFVLLTKKVSCMNRMPDVVANQAWQNYQQQRQEANLNIQHLENVRLRISHQPYFIKRITRK